MDDPCILVLPVSCVYPNLTFTNILSNILPLKRLSFFNYILNDGYILFSYITICQKSCYFYKHALKFDPRQDSNRSFSAVLIPYWKIAPMAEEEISLKLSKYWKVNTPEKKQYSFLQSRRGWQNSVL